MQRQTIRSAPSIMNNEPGLDDGGAECMAPHTNIQRRQCQIVGCCVDVHALNKRYCMKKRACPEHLRAPAVELTGRDGLWRFCNQCGTFQDLSCFDGERRSCRVRLELRRSQQQRASRQHEVPAKRRACDAVADAANDCNSVGSVATRRKKACSQAQQPARSASTGKASATAQPATGEEDAAPAGLLPAIGSGTWQLPGSCTAGDSSIAGASYEQQLEVTEEVLVQALLAQTGAVATPALQPAASLATSGTSTCEARVAQLAQAAAEFAGTISAMREPTPSTSDCPMKQQLVEELVCALFDGDDDDLCPGSLGASVAATPTCGGACTVPLPSPTSAASVPCPPHVLASTGGANGACLTVSAAGRPSSKELAGRMAVLQHGLATMAAQLQQLEGFVQWRQQHVAAPGTCPAFSSALDRQASRASCATHLP